MRLTKLLVLISFALLSSVHAQDLSTLGKKGGISIVGGLSTNQIIYSAIGIDNRRDPYSYFYTGNLDFNLYGWSIPLSFAYSNQGEQFQQPFNQYSIHPTYKGISTHIGNVSANYSPYTLSGHLFLGAAVDAKISEHLTVSGMYGRLLKAVVGDTSLANFVPSTFQRMGYGTKIGYKNKNDFIDAIVFGAHDEINTLPVNSIDPLLSPEENLVVSLSGGKQLLKRLLVKMEWAGSMLTSNSEASDLESNSQLFDFFGIYERKSSTSFRNAIRSEINYSGDLFTTGVSYERVDPHYRTLGAYFFNNDLENTLWNFSSNFLKKKVNLTTSLGFQRNNLNDDELSEMKRIIGSANLAVQASKKMNVSTSYSTFQTFTNIRSQFESINSLTEYDLLDTLNFTQISKNIGLNVSYNLKSSKKRRSFLNINSSLQQANEKQNDRVENAGSNFYNLNTMYSYSMIPEQLTISISLNGNKNNGGSFSSTTVGPTASVSKKMLSKKLKTTFSTSFNNTLDGDNKSISRVLNFRLGSSYTIKKKHKFNLSFVTVNRQSSKNFTEFTVNLGYNYNFQILKSKPSASQK